jgi:mannose-6-phosphate isomerase-like protein (cupin superfamily)
MDINKINIAEKLALFHDHWNPRIIGELNGQAVKLAKLKGEFVWHRHDNEDELFLVLKGEFTMQLRDKNVPMKEGDMIIIPRGVEHRPVADEEVSILLFEPITTLNTGNAGSDLTRYDLERI